MLRVFAADESDLDWMYRLYLGAAEAGHFVMQHNNEGHAVVLNNLSSIITGNQMKDFDLRAQALVFERDSNRVGYAVMSEIRAGMGGNEIHLFVVDKEYRGQGYGKMMLDEVIQRWHPVVDIYARCFPASSAMADMLRKANFCNEGKNKEGADVYRLLRAS